MVRPRPYEPPRRKDNPSSIGKWIFILIICGGAAWAYMHEDLVMQKIHYLIHGNQKKEEEVPAIPPPAPPQPLAPAPAPAAVGYPTPEVNSQYPCAAYAKDPAQFQACNDREQKIQRMQKDAAERDKAFLPPPPPALPGNGSHASTTNTTGK